MKGLITKDFCLMLQRKRSFIIIAVCGIIMGITSSPEFLVGWLILIGSLFSLSTIAYDEHENSFPFLMTLPVSRKCYAVEKYVFGIINGVVFWLIGIIFCVACILVQGLEVNVKEEAVDFLILLMVPFLLLDISIPFNLKYGSEKGRIYMIVLWGLLFAVCFALSKFMSPDSALALSADSVTGGEVLGVLVPVTAALTAASIAWSIRIMQKKEF